MEIKTYPKLRCAAKAVLKRECAAVDVYLAGMYTEAPSVTCLTRPAVSSAHVLRCLNRWQRFYSRGGKGA